MAPKTKEKEVDPGWEHGEMVAGDRHKVKCKWCHKILSGGIHRFKQHLAGIQGEAKPCANVPTEVRKEMRDVLLEKKNEKEKKKKFDERVVNMQRIDTSDSEDDSDGDGDVEARELRRAFRASREQFASEQARMDETRDGAGSSRAPPDPYRDTARRGTMDPFLHRSQSTKQPKISSSIMGDMKVRAMKMGRAISKFFHYNRIPPNVANSPYYRSMVDTIAEVGPGVKPPSAYEIGGKYLDMEVSDYWRYLEDHFKTWEEYGCTLMCDGWTSNNRRHIINFMAYCVTGTVFIRSVDTSGHRMDAEYLYSLIDDTLAMVNNWHKYVVAIVTDNAPNFKAAAKKLREKGKGIIWVPCAAHCIDLMLEDIGKLDDVRDTIDKEKMVTSLIYNHQFMTDLLREMNEGREILRPGITRFATHFVALESLCRAKANIMQMWTSTAYVKSKFSRQPLARKVQQIVLGEDFWNRAERITDLLEPLVLVLKLVDADTKPTMGFVYDAMDRAKLAIEQRSRGKYGTYYKKIWKIIDNRWDNQMHQDIHAAGNF